MGLTDGGRARVVTEQGSAEATVEVNDIMQPGHVSLPNGLGVSLPGRGRRERRRRAAQPA
ncbi:hypothetical protein G5V59_17875 [Nocardioides sp. W3-2-3]|uniref:hypothetical protein n=1 Tax=Nocardioides convexus TaxID=2712224 RepID=UPI00241882EE|nr:hypothetical protein [Nocardioides convexus]NHA01116.1 hypothetical protein [Nocardioides convexus]